MSSSAKPRRVLLPDGMYKATKITWFVGLFLTLHSLYVDGSYGCLTFNRVGLICFSVDVLPGLILLMLAWQMQLRLAWSFFATTTLSLAVSAKSALAVGMNWGFDGRATLFSLAWAIIQCLPVFFLLIVCLNTLGDVKEFRRAQKRELAYFRRGQSNGGPPTQPVVPPPARADRPAKKRGRSIKVTAGIMGRKSRISGVAHR